MERRHRVEVLFHEALALEPGARTSFLEEACSGEPGLLEEVVSLISAHEQSWSFIDGPFNPAQDQANDELSQSLIGTSIGRYQVVRLIKRSGMGEVYLARDTHLPREVALKLLPLMFTGDEKRLRRFILEAEAASSLNHPNILTIHEIGHIHDVHYIATEFVDGQTLRERLADGRLKLSEALEIAVGVTNALVASHAAGIVHRDIKPENIMIRRDGYVKVLDFGLAKLAERPDVRVDGSSPSISSMDTDPGTFMGTIGYLSPEQAKSLEVDTRSDLFSLGVVLYEMIAGQNPFNRDAFSEVVNAILTTEPPPLASFLSNTPAALQKIVTKALSKDKQDRYQRTEDLLADLKRVQAQLQQPSMPKTFTPGARWRRIGIGVVGVIAVALLGVAILKVLNRSRNSEGVGSAPLGFTEIQSWKSERGEGPIDARFSHTGKWITFTMMKNQEQGIWVKPALMGAEPRQLTIGTTYNTWPIWSSDDQQIAFVSTREGKAGIWSIPVNGGPETLLSPIEGSTVRTRIWSKDSRTIYYEMNSNLFGLDVDTGKSTQLTYFEPRSSYRHFSVSPTEDRICYVEVQNGQTDIWVASLKDGKAFRVTDDVEEDRSPLWHPDGRRIIYTSNRGGAFQICVAYVEERTKPSQVTVGGADHLVADVSEDGTRFLDVSSHADAAIFGMEVNTARESEFTSGNGLKLWPEVSPDGRTIVFQSTNTINKLASNSVIAVKPATSEGPMTSIASSGFSPSWSPDGSRISFLRFVEGKFDIFAVGAAGQDEKRLTTGGVVIKGYNQLPTTKFGRSICWSANGDQIVYSARRSGVTNIWAAPIDGSAPIQLTANTDPNLALYEPVCGTNDRIAFAAETQHLAVRTWSLWVNDHDRTKLVYQGKSLLRPIGWSDTGDELIAGSDEKRGNFPFRGFPTMVKVIRLSVDGRDHPIALLESTYFWMVQLAPDRRAIAFVSNKDGSDNVWLTDTSGAEPRRLTANNDPKIYFPSLDWSAGGEFIYYGKQTSIGLITLIDNFE